MYTEKDLELWKKRLEAARISSDTMGQRDAYIKIVAIKKELRISG